MPRFRGIKVGEIRDQASQRQKIVDPKRTADPACMDALCVAQEMGALTAFDRFAAQQPQCGFGLTGVCCRICVQGPCRITAKSDANKKGVCGAADYTVVGRNVARMVAGGAACHSEHGHHIAKTLLHITDGKTKDYRITDAAKLRAVAALVGIETAGRSDEEIAKGVALAALEDYHKVEDTPCTWLMSTITPGRRAKFTHCDIAPSTIDRAIVEIISQTAMGMDADPVNIIFGALRTALADYTGMHIATDLSDIVFGTPRPIVTEANLGVLDPEYVNIATHGHNPTLSEMVVEAARALEAEAKRAQAKGIKVVGICCTGNELLMRKGVALAGNQATQELAIMTGVLDAMIVDIQCIMPGLKPLSECFHTRFITTSEQAKIPASYHFDFREENALEIAKDMVRLAIDGYKSRDQSKVKVSKHKNQVVAGWSLEAMKDLFGALNPERPVKVLTDAIMEGKVRGVCLFAGCNNLRVPHDESHLTIAKTLAANNVLMLATGCAAGAFAKAGLMSPAAVDAYAGEGLKSFLKDLETRADLGYGLPLIFHMGSCVDNVRAFDLCVAMAEELGVDIPKVPFAASAPEDMHEKAVSIGTWCVAMGLPVHVGVVPPIEGSELIYGLVTQIAHDVYGGHFMFEQDPKKAAELITEALNYRTWKLGVHHYASKKYETPLAVNW